MKSPCPSVFLPALKAFFLLFLFVPARAQVKGVIIDQVSRQPVIGASVYVNNTTYGCQSDVDGRFELQYFPPPPYSIIISSVGYESASLNVEAKTVFGITVALKPKANELNEVVILAPEKNGWELYGQDFIRDFIGYSDFAAECEILNKKDLEFRYDKNAMKLFVSARKPVKIRNKATGYLITYWLDDYEKDYKSRRLFYKGTVQFESMLSKSSKKNLKWTTNRASAFNGSLNHFMRSVYNNTVYEDSFELRVYKKVPARQYGRSVPFRQEVVSAAGDTAVRQALKTFLHFSDSGIVRLGPALARWQQAANYAFNLEETPADSTKEPGRRITFSYNTDNPAEKRMEYYDYSYIPVDSAYERAIAKETYKDPDGVTRPVPRRKTPESFAYLWTQKMPTDSFVTRTPDHKVLLRFRDYLHVTYLKEKEESAYLNGQHPHTHFIPEQQQSLISLDNPEGVAVFPDGNFSEVYDLLAEEYWSYEKLDKMMPLDYQP